MSEEKMDQRLRQLCQQIENAQTLLAEIEQTAHEIMTDHRRLGDQQTAFCLARLDEFRAFQSGRNRPARGIVGLPATGNMLGLDIPASGETASTRLIPTSPTIAAGPVITQAEREAAQREELAQWLDDYAAAHDTANQP